MSGPYDNATPATGTSGATSRKKLARGGPPTAAPSAAKPARRPSPAASRPQRRGGREQQRVRLGHPEPVDQPLEQAGPGPGRRPRCRSHTASSGAGSTCGRHPGAAGRAGSRCCLDRAPARRPPPRAGSGPSSARRRASLTSRCSCESSVASPARSSRSCAFARCSRVFTVFSGMPSSRPASRVVSPSSTVACTTARISGDSRRSAAPRSPYSTPSSTRSSALRRSGCPGRVDLLQGQDQRLAAAAQPRHQATDRDPPQPRGDFAVAAPPAGALPHRRRCPAARRPRHRGRCTAGSGARTATVRAGRTARAARRGPRRGSPRSGSRRLPLPAAPHDSTVAPEGRSEFPPSTKLFRGTRPAARRAIGPVYRPYAASEP